MISLVVALVVALLVGGRRSSRAVDRRRGDSKWSPARLVERVVEVRDSRPGRIRRRAVAALPEVLELTARTRRAGQPLLPALRWAAPSVPAVGLSPWLTRVESGAGLAESLDGWAATIDHEDADLVVAVLLLSDESGAAVAARLDRTAATLRERAALRDEIRALTAQARTSALVVGLAPVGLLGLLVLVEPRQLGTMFGSGVGRAALVVGLVLDGVGVWWMRRLAGSVT